MGGKERVIRSGEAVDRAVAVEVVLRDFSACSRDPLGLLDEPTTVVRIPNPQRNSTITLAYPHRPFAGEHLAQFVNSLAPFPSLGKEGIVMDLRMPIVAKRKLAQGKERNNQSLFDEVSLHIDHMHDPQIQEAYSEFVDQNLKRMLQAFSYNASDPVFYEAQRVLFIRDEQTFLDSFYSDVDLSLDRGETDHFNEVPYLALYGYQHGNVFAAFFKSKPDYTIDEKQGYIPGQFLALPEERRVALLREFIDRFSPEERKAFAFSLFEKFCTTVIDLKIRHIRQGAWHHSPYFGKTKPPTIEFVDSGVVSVRNREGARVIIAPYKDIGFGRVGGKCGHYRFTPDYYAGAAYAVVAYETTSSGDRRFLRREEAEPIMRALFHHSRWANVKLGEILAAYLLPDVTEKWTKTMGLLGRKRNQRMMGAQMFVWPSLEDHSRQLFSEGEALFATIDQIADAA